MSFMIDIINFNGHNYGIWAQIHGNIVEESRDIGIYENGGSYPRDN